MDRKTVRKLTALSLLGLGLVLALSQTASASPVRWAAAESSTVAGEGLWSQLWQHIEQWLGLDELDAGLFQDKDGSSGGGTNMPPPPGTTSNAGGGTDPDG